MCEKLIAAIRQHVASEYPNEACGVVIQSGHNQLFIPCRNIASQPGDAFTLSPEDKAAAQERGEIIMIVHSHPDVVRLVPSEMDRIQCDWSGIEWGIMSWPDGDFCTIFPREERDYVGRPWLLGYADCWSLIREYYQREFNITLRDHSVPYEWWESGSEHLYDDNWQEEGLVEVDPGDMKPGDIIMMRVQASVTNHAAVYLGDNIILHHLFGHLSSRTPYGKYYRDRTVRITRHRENTDDKNAHS